MARPRCQIVRFLFCVVVCVLIWAAFSSELPELLTLTNDSSNDYTLRSPAFKNVGTLRSLRRDTGSLVVAAPLPSAWHFLLPAPRITSLQAQSLFPLHSVLRT